MHYSSLHAQEEGFKTKNLQKLNAKFTTKWKAGKFCLPFFPMLSSPYSEVFSTVWTTQTKLSILQWLIQYFSWCFMPLEAIVSWRSFGFQFFFFVGFMSFSFTQHRYVLYWSVYQKFRENIERKSSVTRLTCWTTGFFLDEKFSLHVFAIRHMPVQ